MVCCSLRDQHGRILRSLEAKKEFNTANPCPANGLRFGRCPGYVIDHVKAPACGGDDLPLNKQWQTVEDVRLRISGSVRAVNPPPSQYGSLDQD